MSYKILLRKHPFLQTSYETFEKTKSEPIEKLLKEFDIKQRYIFAVNGVISDDLKYKPRNGDLITIKVLPEGGPDEARSAGEKTAGWGGFLVVVGFITSFFFAPVGLAIMGVGLTVGFVGAGIMGIADMWDKLSKSANLTMTKNLPQIAGSRNSINPWGKIPVVLGTHKISPYYASKPYTTISGTDGDTQYLYELFAIGYKTLSISDIKIGETLLASNSADVRNGTITIDGNYSDVTLEIRQDGTLPANWSNTILEDSISVQAKYGKETWRTTPDKTTKAVVEIYLPRGLFRYKDDGGTDNHSVTVEVKYRTAGSTTPWESCQSIGTLNITRNTTTAMRFRFEKTLSAGKYEIGVKRTSADDTTDSKKMSDTYWSIMQSWTASAPVSTSMLGKVCLLAVKIKATDQLNGVIDNLNLIAKSVVRVGPNWNTSTISNNPADLFVHVATQAANARAIPDNKIDWSVVNAWRTTCVNKGWTCNAVITSGEKLKSVLNRIAQTGRASLNLRDGLYSVVVDEPKSTIVQHFTNKNVKNFAWTKSFTKTPHGIRVNFLSASDGYASSERKVFDDGYSEVNATEYLQLDMWGITDPNLAWKHGRYRIACMKLRPEIYTFETDPEGIICEPGDLVLVSHDAISVGQKSGRIKNLIISGSTITGFELDEIVTMETGKNYGIKIRKNDGTFVSYQITTSAGDKTLVSLTSAIPVSGGPQVDDLYTFGEYGTETLRCIVIGYEPTSDYGIKLYLTDEAPGVHTADSGTIPDYEPLITRQAEEVTLDKISGEITRIDNDLFGLSGTLNSTPSKRIIVNLYQELAITPELPSADITVDLLNNTYTNLTNNWSPTQPQAVREPIWMINYSTIIPVTQNEITITAVSWPSPIKIFIGTPMYLGMIASIPDGNSFPNKIEGDWCLCTADGKFYKWTGSAWTDSGITTQNKMAALQDLLTIADASDATAFCQTLVSVDAFIQNLMSKYLQLQSGGAIYSGGYTQAGENPSNLPGIYIGADGNVKCESISIKGSNLGSSNVPVYHNYQYIFGSWGSETVVNSAHSSYLSLCLLPSGEVLLVYRRGSDTYLVQRIRSTNGKWGSESVVNAANSLHPSLCLLPSGEVLLVYRRVSDGYLIQRVRSTNGTWGAESVVNAASSDFPSLCLLPSGEVLLVYQRVSDGYLVQRIRSTNGTWGAESVVNAANSLHPSLCLLPSGEVLLVYRRVSDGYLIQRVRSTNGTWGAESVVNAAITYMLSLCLLPSGEVLLVYRRPGDYYLIQRIRSTNGTWGAESIVNAASSDFPSLCLLPSGEVLLVYIRSSDYYLLQRLNTPAGDATKGYVPCALGAGIIEVGKNTNGSWIKWSDGSVIQVLRKSFPGNGTAAYENIELSPSVEVTSAVIMGHNVYSTYHGWSLNGRYQIALAPGSIYKAGFTFAVAVPSNHNITISISVLGRWK